MPFMRRLSNQQTHRLFIFCNVTFIKKWHRTPKKTFSLEGRRVFVAGHNGMVGRALLRRLAKENCDILTVNRKQLDLKNFKTVND